jgi:hypothetical protein
VASRVPVPSYVVPTDRFPPRRHEFEQRFVESRQTTGRRGLPVGEFETRQISVPTRLPTRCERLLIAPVPVNDHGANLVGVPARCPAATSMAPEISLCRDEFGLSRCDVFADLLEDCDCGWAAESALGEAGGELRQI